MKNKIYKIVVCLLICVFTVMPVKAAENENLNIDIPISEKIKNEQILEKKEEKIILRSSTHESKRLNVTAFQQNSLNYCGPACVQMAVYYLTGNYYSQTELANYMGTDSSGTYVYQVKNGLNAYIGQNYYAYKTLSQLDIVQGTKSTINDNHPVVANVNPAVLYGSTTSTQHYVLIIGYDYTWPGTPVSSTSNVNATYPKYITYIDPYGEHFGTLTVSADLMRSAITNCTGYYIY